MDPGSQASFITEECFNKLRMKRRRRITHFAGIEAVADASNGVASIWLTPRDQDSQAAVKIEVHILHAISTDVPAEPVPITVDEQTYYHPLADPHFSRPGPIDVLIGADSIYQFMPNGGPPGSSLRAVFTTFGWVIF